MKNVANWQEKDAMDHADLNWFDGNSKFINTDSLLHQIAGIGKKSKRTKMQKYLSDIQHKVSSEKTVFSKSINGQNCVHYRHSSNDNICQRGFYAMYRKRICGYNYCLAFYKSKADAKLALKMVIFAGKIPNILSDSDISRLLNNLEDKKHIAVFFGFVSEKGEEVILNIPINENQPLKGIWQEFNCESIVRKGLCGGFISLDISWLPSKMIASSKSESWNWIILAFFSCSVYVGVCVFLYVSLLVIVHPPCLFVPHPLLDPCPCPCLLGPPHPLHGSSLMVYVLF